MQPTSTSMRSAPDAPRRTRPSQLEPVPAALREKYFGLRTARSFSPRPAALRHLRPARPPAGPADLAHRPAGVAQHAHVLRCGVAAAHPRQLPLRIARRRFPVPRQVRGSGRALAPVQRRRPKRRIFAKVPTAARGTAPYPPRARRQRRRAGGTREDVQIAGFDASPSRRSSSTAAGLLPRRITRRGCSSASATVTWARCCRISSSHIGRSSCARGSNRRYSERPRPDAPRCRVARGSGSPVPRRDGPPTDVRRRRSDRHGDRIQRRHAVPPARRGTPGVKRELEIAYEELQSTVEELETTNEELQSTNEELETTNEELQSTNEELETMNEELQATNEELETINDELQLRTDELNELNAFLEAVLASFARPSSPSIAICESRRGTTRRASSGGCDPARCTVSICSISTSDCRWRSSAHRFVQCSRATAGRRSRSTRSTGAERRSRSRRRFAPLSTNGSDVRGAIVMMEASDA